MTEEVMGLFILDGKGSFDQGFIVSLKNYSGDLPSLSAMEDGVSGELPPSPDLPVLYEAWKDAYRNYLEIRAYNPNANNGPAALALKKRLVEENVAGSYQEWETQKQQAYHACTQAEKALLKRFHEWLNCKNFDRVKDTLKAYLLQSKDKANRILIESNDKDFQKMPWQKWDLLTPFSLSEVGLSSPNFKKRYVPIKPKERARVLVILGKDANIQQEIEKLATANIEIKVVTNLAGLDEPLWNEAWDIIVFNGHSGTSEKGTEGKFQLSQDQWLKIEDIRNHLDKAINQGLKLVIFNSCDGLGLAHQLGEGQQLYLPQIMVMRDLLPVPLAPIFLQYFFEEFIKGISLYSALRATRNRLEFPTIKDEYPCASWLPVICQNPAVEPTTWNQLIGIDESSRRKATANVQNQLSRQEFKNRRALLAQVRTEVWGLLEQSLHHAVLINLHKENQPDLVKRSWDVEVKVGKTQSRESVNSNIIQIFDRESIAGKLLILGAPGAGKTTTQLELAQELIKRAENDANEPMPVLFNLSSWKDDNQTIVQWLINRLKIDYGVPQKIGKNWLREQQILPLLDGLDELASERQKKCVQAINQFMESEERPLYIVVCSRSEEYELWKTPLNLNGAICLSPLTQPQIKQYLADVNLSKLWEEIKDFSVILDLIKTPLFLSMMTLAYESLSIDEWGSYTTKETCREYLFKVYVERMLKRPIKNIWFTESKKPSDKQVKYYLSWLANNLRFSTEFYIESLQPDCLKNKANRIIYMFLTNDLFWLKIYFLVSLFFLSPLMFFFWSQRSNLPGITGVAGAMIIIFGLCTFFDFALLIMIIIFLGWSCFLLVYGWPVLVEKFFISYWLSGNVSMAISSFVVILLPLIYMFIKGSFDLYFKFNDWFNSPKNWLKKFFSKNYVNDVGRIYIVDSLRWSWNDAKENFIAGLVTSIKVFTAIVGIPALMFVLIYLLMVIFIPILYLLYLLGLIYPLPTFSDAPHPLDVLRGVSLALLIGLLLGIICGLIGGFLMGIFHGLRVQEVELEDKKIPNQGIYSSLKNTILVITVYAIPSSLVFSILIFIIDKFNEIYSIQNIFLGGYLGIIFGFFLSMVLGINGKQLTPDFDVSQSGKGFTGTQSAKAVIQHFVLRLLLWFSGYIPWNYARFLNYATERMLLQRVGGRYRFIHRFLQEYFANIKLN